MSIKYLDTLTGKGRLQLTDRLVPVDYEINVFQKFHGNTPTLKSATGRVMNLPRHDARSAMTAMRPAALELEDGRKAQVLLIDLNGTIQVTF